MKLIQRKLGFECGLEVDPVGKKRGLALLWNSNVELEIDFAFHIHALVKESKS